MDLTILLWKIFDIITIGISLYYLYVSLYSLKQKKTSQYFVYLIFYLFFLFPILYQFIFGIYYHNTFKKVNDAMNSPLPNILYDLFCIIVIFAFSESSRIDNIKNKFISDHDVCNRNILLKKICSLLLYIPIIIMLCNISFWASLVSGNLEIMKQYLPNETILGISLISYYILLTYRPDKKKLIQIFLPVLFYSIIVGKRYYLVELGVMTLFTMFMTEQIDSKKIFRYLLLAFFSILMFCYVYGVFIKGNLDSLFGYFNIDLSRQYSLIYCFYADINNIPISVNQFDSIISIFFFWIPRGIWMTKPYPFVNALTRSMLGFSPENINLGWATTTSIFADMFDSFSYLGLIVALFFIVYLMKKINREKRMYFKVLLMYLVIRMLILQLSASIIQITFMYLVIKVCNIIKKSKRL